MLGLGQARGAEFINRFFMICHAKLFRNPACGFSLTMFSTNKYINNDCEA